MFCKKCGAEIEDGAAFCSKCGTPLEAQKVFCPGCGEEIKDSAQFCPKCGTKVKTGFNINTGDIANRISQASEKGLQVASKLAKDAKSGSEELINKVKNSENPSLQAIKENISGKSISPILLILAAIHVIQLILWFCESIYVSSPSFGIKETVSMHEACEEAVIISVITIILLCLSIVLNIISGLIKDLKLTCVIVGIFSQLWFLGWLVIERVAMTYILDNSEYGDYVIAGFLGAGKFMVLLCVISLALYLLKIVTAKKAKTLS